MNEPFHVLLSAAGRRVALLNLFRQALGQLGLTGSVMAADMSAASSAFHAADRAFLVPACRDPAFIPSVLDVCRREGIRLVIPTIDTELPMYAAHRDAFAAIGATVAISSPEVVEIAGSKDRTHAFLLSHGFPTVRQATVEAVRQEPERWPFPLVVKPRAGSASIGVRVVGDAAELEVAARGGDTVVQSLAPGQEYTVEVLCNRQGRCLCAVPRKRLEVRAGEVSKGMTVRLPQLEALATAIAEALPGAFGTLNIQIFREPKQGETAVIEINARFGGGHPLACAAGAHYPRWLIEEVAGLPSSARADGWRHGVVMLRYDEAVFVDAAAAGVTP